MRPRVRRLRHLVLLLAGVTALAACRSGAGASPPAPAPGPTAPPVGGAAATTTAALPTSPREQVEAAYLRSWAAYARAVATRDPPGLEQAYGGRALELVRSEVIRRRAENRPARARVDHDYTIRLRDADTATVIDGYLSHQVRIDPATGRAIEPDPRERRLEAYTLRRIGDDWLVTEVVGLA